MSPSWAASGSTLRIAALFGALFLATLDNQLLIPLLPTLGREFSLGAQALGWLFGGYALAAALFSLLFGPLTDRVGRTAFLKAGLLLIVLTSICTYFVTEFYQLLLLRILAGLGGGLLSTCTASLVGDRFSYESRGRVMGIVLSSYFVALILGVPLAALVAERWHWRGVFLFSGALAFLLFLLSALVLFGRPGPREGSDTNDLRNYRDLLAHATTRTAVLVSFGVSGATLAFLTFISKYLDETFGLGPVEISWLFLLAGVAAALSSPLAGWMSDRFSKRWIFLVFNTLLALPLLLLTQVPWGGALLGTFFLISLCIAFRQTALQTLQTELVQEGRRGAFLALRNAFSQLGISVSVTVAGALYAGAGYFAVTLWAVLLTLISSILLYGAVEEPCSAK